jgi:hypothetical protein
MMGRIPEEKIQEIRERLDIVEVVSSYLPLKRSGANHQGLCPFHGEKTPSFNVNAPRQIFHCFGCGVGGNVFSFLMRMEGLSFPEAVRRLGERVGVEVEEETLSPVEEKRREEVERLVRINEVAADFYHRILLDEPEGAAARRYLRERGYDGEAARRFRLGYAPERWDALAKHLETKGFDPALVREKLGLVRPGRDGRSDYDLFRRRLLFPISDSRGQVVAFGGRVMDDSLPKYINSPESPVEAERGAQGRSVLREEACPNPERHAEHGARQGHPVVRRDFGQRVVHPTFATAEVRVSDAELECHSGSPVERHATAGEDVDELAAAEAEGGRHVRRDAVAPGKLRAEGRSGGRRRRRGFGGGRSRGGSRWGNLRGGGRRRWSRGHGRRRERRR